MRIISIILLSIVNSSILPHIIFADNTGSDYSCSLAIYSIDFGYFNPYDYTASKLSSRINVQCVVTKGAAQVNYVITFSSGNSGNAYNRAMLNNPKTLMYNLYADSALTQVLGNGFNKTNSFAISYLLNAEDGARNDNFTMYGMIPIQPLAEVGKYYDNIIVTLSY